MAGDDGRDSKRAAPGGERDESLASAETRVLTDDEADALESGPLSDLELEESEAATVLAVEAEESAARPSAALAADETRVVSEDDEDRTQLVTRAPGATFDSREDARAGARDAAGESAGPDADASKPTRVLDPSISPEPSARSRDVTPGESSAGRALPDTRVLEDPDKTAPPPVDEGAAAAAVAARAAASERATPRPAAARSPELDRGLAPGTVLFGEYEIVNVLGVGGMGEVYRAKHRRLGEHRAIKVMHAELSKKKGASEFFYREAKALLAVRHPAVAHCHDMLSDDAGRVYLIMEMIEGIPLSKKMNDGPLSPDDVAVLGARVSHGLAAAHRKGVIHRDVSPDNIVLPNGRVQEAKIIDFGIAKLLEEGEGTIVDGFKGKLSYASPEQLGFFGGKIDGRSDFYSLGLVLVAAALGRPMPMGTTVVEAVDARRNFKTLPDAIPVGLRSAIQPLLALDPDDRPRYVDRLFVVPGASGDSGPISTGAIERSGTAKKPAASNRVTLLAGSAAAAALVLGGGLYLGAGGLGGAASAPGSSPEVLQVPVPADGREAATIAPAEEAPPEFVPAAQEAAPVEVAKKPETPKPRRITGSDRLEIIGLLRNARLALEENRLMSPASDNAYDRFVQVLELDPSDKSAKAGLRQIASRYVAMADRAVDKGDLDQARSFVERAKRADSDYPGIVAIDGRLRD